MKILFFLINFKCDFGSFSEEIYKNHYKSTKHKRICGK